VHQPHINLVLTLPNDGACPLYFPPYCDLVFYFILVPWNYAYVLCFVLLFKNLSTTQCCLLISFSRTRELTACLCFKKKLKHTLTNIITPQPTRAGKTNTSKTAQSACMFLSLCNVQVVHTVSCPYCWKQSISEAAFSSYFEKH
jgi:hypothetical protein